MATAALIQWRDPRFDEHQFTKRVRAVSATSEIAFSDFAGHMHVTKRTNRAWGLSRRQPTPDWCQNSKDLRAVVLFYAERRLYLRTGTHRPSRVIPSDWSDSERYENICTASALREQELTGVVDRLTDLHATWRKERVSPFMIAKLSAIIQNFDTELVMFKRGIVAMALGVCYYYHRLRYNSVGVAEELRLKPPHVRQILSRMHQSYLLSRGLERTIKTDRRTKYAEKQRPIREIVKAIAAGMTEGQYLYGREEIRACIADRPIRSKFELFKMSVSYTKLDPTECVVSAKHGPAKDVDFDPKTGRLELCRGELVPNTAPAPMW